MDPRGSGSGLAATQRRLWRLITAPEGVASALAEERGPCAGSVEGWLASDAVLAGARRLEVYANAFFFRIHDCLREDYGALAAAMGGEPFHDLVTAYLLVNPPHHPSLRFAGAGLADFLAADPAAEPFRRRWPWAADLARLEWALVDAFDAADASPLRREALARIPPGRWAAMRLDFHASVRLLRLEWSVYEAREAWERGEAPRPPRPTAIAVCVWRRDEQVCFRPLASLEADLLEAALRRATFGALCRRTEQALGGEAAPPYSAERLARWVADGLVVAASAVPPGRRARAVRRGSTPSS